jgi:pimeloyl-ACP methyl ester carboxylesterase
VTALEHVFTFGASSNLVGILTEPEPAQRRPAAPVFLMWNVGLNHRVGPFRFFVELARRLAAEGFTSLRFDVSGLGDSDVSRDDRRRDAERAEGDVRTAMQALASQRGFEAFVPVGFCSGVDAAHALVQTENAVSGAIFLEGYAFDTPGYRLRYAKRFLDRNRWERFFRMRFPRAFGEPPDWSDPLSERETVYVREYPTPQRFGKEIRAVAERGVKMLFIYVAGDSTYAYRDQLFESTGRGSFESNIDVEFYADADHTFSLRRHRERALARVIGWATSTFATTPLEQRAASAR